MENKVTKKEEEEIMQKISDDELHLSQLVDYYYTSEDIVLTQLKKTTAERKSFERIWNVLPNEMKDNDDFLVKVLKINGLFLYFLPKEQQEKRLLAEEALNTSPMILVNLDDSIKKDKVLVEKAIRSSSFCLSYMHDSLKNDDAFLNKMLDIIGENNGGQISRIIAQVFLKNDSYKELINERLKLKENENYFALFNGREIENLRNEYEKRSLINDVSVSLKKNKLNKF